MNSRFSSWERQLPSYNIEEVERSEYQLGAFSPGLNLKYVLLAAALIAAISLYRRG